MVPNTENIVDVLDVLEYHPSVLQGSEVWKTGHLNLVYLTLDCIFSLLLAKFSFSYDYNCISPHFFEKNQGLPTITPAIKVIFEKLESRI